jgi:beta-glucanase (GH16 family)
VIEKRIGIPRVLVFLTCASLSGGVSSGEVLIWSEEFGAGPSLDGSVWSHDLGDGCAAGICGWGNNELQDYTDDPANVRVEGGELIITALRQTVNGPGDPGPDEYTFSSGRIKTQGRLAFRYATIEARIRLPDLADGLWPAFWTLGSDITAVGWPACGEIDIFEMGSAGAIADGAINRRVGSTAHWDFGGNHASYGLAYTSPADLHDSYHVYRMEWTPTYVSTYIDGIWIWTMNLTDPQSFGGEEFHQPHFLILDLAVGGNYTGITGDGSDITATFPAEYRVDWIRVYDNGSTTLVGPGAPIALSAARTGTDVELSFDTAAGVAYEVLYKTSLADPTWSLLQDVSGNGTAMSVFDPLDSSASFYLVEPVE